MFGFPTYFREWHFNVNNVGYKHAKYYFQTLINELIIEFIHHIFDPGFCWTISYANCDIQDLLCYHITICCVSFIIININIAHSFLLPCFIFWCNIKHYAPNVFGSPNHFNKLQVSVNNVGCILFFPDDAKRWTNNWIPSPVLPPGITVTIFMLISISRT